MLARTEVKWARVGGEVFGSLRLGGGRKRGVRGGGRHLGRLGG